MTNETHPVDQLHAELSLDHLRAQLAAERRRSERLQKRLETARRDVADALNCCPSQVDWTTPEEVNMDALKELNDALNGTRDALQYALAQMGVEE